MENPVENGIVDVCRCKCGNGIVRMHTHLFKTSNESIRKHYADCTSCEKVSDWCMSADEALAKIDMAM